MSIIQSISSSSTFLYFQAYIFPLLFKPRDGKISIKKISDKAVLKVYFLFWSDSIFRSYWLLYFLVLDVIVSYYVASYRCNPDKIGAAWHKGSEMGS
jgi:hypothetical protein